MPTTTRGYTYPALTDSPNGPSQMQTMATNIDTDVGNLYTRFGQRISIIEFTPGAPTNSSSSGTTTWVTLGNITVPSWVTSCLGVTWSINGFTETGVSGNATVAIALGANATTSVRILGPGTTGPRGTFAVAGTALTLPGTGVQSVTVKSTFISGTLYTVDTLTRITAKFEWA